MNCTVLVGMERAFCVDINTWYQTKHLDLVYIDRMDIITDYKRVVLNVSVHLDKTKITAMHQFVFISDQKPLLLKNSTSSDMILL